MIPPPESAGNLEAEIERYKLDIAELSNRSKALEAENIQLKHAVAELAILNEIATAIDSSMSVDEINRLIVTKCIKHFDVEQGVIWMINPSEPGQPGKTVIRGMRSSADGIPIHLGTFMKGWIEKNKKPLLSNDMPNDDRFVKTPKESFEIKSVLAVPMWERDRMVGILSVLNRKDNKPFDGPDQRLLTIIATQSAQVMERAVIAEMEKDLNAANVIQMGLIPKSVPNTKDFDLYGFSEPAREVGGDYYDWVSLNDNRLGCVVADVSGKGVPAALLMAQLHGIFRAQAQSGKTPKDVVTSVNEFLGATMEASRFVTLFYAIFDPGKNELTYCSAGHNPPLVWRSDGSLEWLGEGGLILSAVSAKPYEEHTVGFGSGDLIVIYTDGVTEAQNAKEVLWDEPGLEKSLTEGSRDSSSKVGDRIRSDLKQFVAGHEQTDDITLMVIRYK